MIIVLPVAGGQAAPSFLMSFWKAGTCSTFSVCAAIIDGLQLWLQQQCFEPAAKRKPDPVTSGALDIAKMQPRRMWLNNLNLKRSKHCTHAHFLNFILKKPSRETNTGICFPLQSCSCVAVFTSSAHDSAGTDNVQIIYKKLDLTIGLKM